MISNFLAFAKTHKKTSALLLVILILVVYGGWKMIAPKGDTVRYVTTPAQKGTLVVAVFGNGQVESSNQVEVKSKASGDVLKINFKNGDEVKANAALVTLNTKDAYKTYRDAQINLESAKLSLEKLKQPATAYELLQSENALKNAQVSLEKLKLSQANDEDKANKAKTDAEQDLANAYDDSYNIISQVFLDLPNIMEGIYSVLYSNDISDNEPTTSSDQPNASVLLNSFLANDEDQSNQLSRFFDDAKAAYNTAKTAYDPNFNAYKNITREASPATVETLLNQTLTAVKKIANAVKSETNVMDYWVEYRNTHNLNVFTTIKNYQIDLSGYTTKSNTHITNLTATLRSIQNAKEAFTDAERSLKEMKQNNPLDLAAAEANIKERQASLTNLKNGTDILDIRSQELTIKQRQNSVADAAEKLADYTIRAPFKGIITASALKKGDNVSSGESIATLITKQHVATVSLNEVDVAKVAVGQKVTITFDAIEGLTITGTVSEMDTLGTMSQGVVSYNIKIAFDTQDDRIKSGMNLSAGIITQALTDVLLVPGSAVKFQSNNMTTVDVLKEGQSVSVPVTVGASNDTSTEITGGLQEGDEVITQVINPPAASAQPAASGSRNILQGLGGTGGGGGSFRAR
ncbi:hypothetical protein COY07_05200 [Candidatus Peregrinibacteria bacterium CG_4_10_14_0_2_um_filter_43_11]|nr:MAG: hypothetical protein COY07_05200 [Candidatus Peregrinibacteria bacterium CG_4_10_14_0_2_um_filter_43_11]